jgi:hypothetical protein
MEIFQNSGKALLFDVQGLDLAGDFYTLVAS